MNSLRSHRIPRSICRPEWMMLLVLILAGVVPQPVVGTDDPTDPVAITDGDAVVQRGEGYYFSWHIENPEYAQEHHLALWDPRYMSLASCPYSPLVGILPYPYTGTLTGAPFARAGRFTADNARTFMNVEGEGDGQPVGLWGDCQGSSLNWVCCTDYAGLAGYASGAPEEMWDVYSMYTDAAPRGPQSYYIMRVDQYTLLDDLMYEYYQSPAVGDIFVREEGAGQEEHAYVYTGKEPNGHLDLMDLCFRDGYMWKGESGYTYMSMLESGGRAICVKSIYDSPRTKFLAVSATACSGATRVEWSTRYLENSWGFAVEASEDGKEWKQVGDYVPAGVPSSPEVKTFSQMLPARPRYIRVVEVTVGTQERTVSREVAVAERAR